MDDIPVTARVVGSGDATDPASCGTGSCGSGACAVPADALGETPRLVDLGDRWQLNVPEAELGAPVVMTTLTARALAHVFLVESAGDDTPVDEPRDVTADVAAVALGFGPLLLQGAYIYSKSCGGPSVSKVTHMGVADLAVLTALFAELGKHSIKGALRDLDTTQRSLLGEAADWAKTNAALVARMRSTPQAVARGDFTIEETRPWILRVLGRKPKEKDVADLTLEELETMASTVSMSSARASVSKPRDAQDSELSSLVAEALADARADAE
jgi:hypothetical protein